MPYNVITVHGVKLTKEGQKIQTDALAKHGACIIASSRQIDTTVWVRFSVIFVNSVPRSFLEWLIS